MTEKQTEQTKPEVQKKVSDNDLLHAIDLVNGAIRTEEERLRKIASTEEQSPILIEGYTTANYSCQLMVDPKDVARILLEYNYPTWAVLRADCPDAMWDDLGRFYGLASVGCVDI